MKKQNNYKKLISSLLVVALLTQIVGCYSYQEITKEEFLQTEEYSDLRVRTKDQNWYEFYKKEYTVKEDSIYGSGRKIFKPGSKFGEDYTGSISLEEIESFKFDKFDLMGTVIFIAIGVGILALIASSIKFGPIFKGSKSF
jgi:hypothetical protein